MTRRGGEAWDQPRERRPVLKGVAWEPRDRELAGFNLDDFLALVEQEVVELLDDAARYHAETRIDFRRGTSPNE
jgi:hypothetical protein